ncbi:MAG: DUF2807 domain-containing protein [Candidatus Kerfeldbacteria bacterium]|nr:DUF2807 domain-containing protein [Candidatus Kerfeldbacteria bacterium]
MDESIKPSPSQPVEQPKQHEATHKSGTNLNWLLVTIALIIIVVMLFGQDRYGDAKTANITIEPFTKIYLQAGVGQLVLKQGETVSLTLAAPEEYHQWVSTEVRNGELIIDADLPWFQRLFFVGPKKESIIYTLTVTELSDLTIDGLMDMRTEGTLTQDSLRIVFNGATDAKLELQLLRLEATLNGAGEMQLSGTADSQLVTIDGAGEIDAQALRGKDVEATLNGAGSAEVHATESLTATLNGAGSIEYAGNPPTVKENINGVGSINPINSEGEDADEAENVNTANTNGTTNDNQNTNGINGNAAN